MPLSLDNRFNSVYRIVYRLLSSNQQHLRCISLPNLYDQQIKRNFPQFNGKLSVTNRCLFHTSKACLSDKIVPFLLSDIGEGINEVIIKEWFVKIGDKISQFDSVCEVQSDKASVTITSRFDGIIDKIYYDIDQTAKVGKPLVDIRICSSSSSPESQPAEAKISEQVVEIRSRNEEPAKDVSGIVWKNDKVLTTPAVRRLAAEHKICLSDIVGSGKDGRIMKEDVYKFIEEMTAARKDAVQDFPTSKLSKHDSESKSTSQREVSVSFTPIQRAMFKSMTQSLKIPHFGLCDEIDLSKLSQLLPTLRGETADLGIKLTFMPFFMKALSITLHKYPQINSVVDEKDEKIVQKMYHNIGFALDTKQGLYVPNVKNVQNKSIIEICTDLKRLQEAASKGSLSPDDLTGGTITLSNIGSIGGTFGIPVIFSPQVVIAAIGQAKTLPRFNSKDEIIKAQIANVLWSADHRIIDGATMCRFSSEWKKLIEEPTFLLLDLK